MNKVYVNLHPLTQWLLVLICCFVHANKQKSKRATKGKNIAFVELCEVWQLQQILDQTEKSMLRIVI